VGCHDDCCSVFHLCCYICNSCYSGGTLDWQITIQLPVLSLALWMVLFCYQYTTGEREGWCAWGLCSWKCFCLKACIIVWYIGTSVSRARVVTVVMDSKVHTFNLHCVVFYPSEILLSMPRIFPTQIFTLLKDLSFTTFFFSVQLVSIFTSTFHRSRFFHFLNFSYFFLDDVKAHVNRCYINIIITTFF
jgi:hypothetical protein